MKIVDIEDLQENTSYCMLWKSCDGEIKELYFFKVIEKLNDTIYFKDLAQYKLVCYYSMKMVRAQHAFIDYPLSIERNDTIITPRWALNTRNGICFELTDSEIDSHLIMESL